MNEYLYINNMNKKKNDLNKKYVSQSNKKYVSQSNKKNSLIVNKNFRKPNTISLTKINYTKPVLECFENINNNKNKIKFNCINYNQKLQSNKSPKKIDFNDLKKKYNLIGINNTDIQVDCIEEIQNGHKIISCTDSNKSNKSNKSESNKWEKHYDDQVQSSYWYNSSTGEATWINPHNGGKTLYKKRKNKNCKTKKQRK